MGGVEGQAPIAAPAPDRGLHGTVTVKATAPESSQGTATVTAAVRTAECVER